MNLLRDILPEFLAALGAAATIALVTAVVRSIRARRTSTSSLPSAPITPTDGETTPGTTIHHFTLLGTTDTNGDPVKLTTTRPAGTTITYRADGGTERFQLTSARLHDGTFAAEPIDRYQ
ncbi:hypothetical protein [Streptomyces sp. NPDC056361]|uniref:hypothetical protein n=1 Tax=Streptomyces sp. NPDC056361 TaxID=3345795 RepID=UPI0035DBB289